ncbi:MAG TPA: DUF2934 domain-containing protein [Terracidiphilus sp.]|jgi:hypothetical protein|nr:DUF2934 domain-containing protein [Terracidiphilus sp.]
MELTQRIRERAYELWITSGSADGNSEVNWLAAEKEILSTNPATPPAKSNVKKSSKGGTGSRKRANDSTVTSALES